MLPVVLLFDLLLASGFVAKGVSSVVGHSRTLREVIGLIIRRDEQRKVALQGDLMSL